MTDRSCRCPGCTLDATAEDLLCDRCRSNIDSGYAIAATLTLLDPDRPNWPGERRHVHAASDLTSHPSVNVYYDTDEAVASGDYLYSRTGTHYLVLAVHVVRRRDPQARRRLQLAVHRLRPDDTLDPTVPRHLILWYTRRRKRPSA